ncbi:porin [Marinobacter qingdaonensis]|uniref:Porin n=1 Tax=Marinobacter qingdaonensis TaxID=3108486 RepID=A0ABU5NYR6_9GAMM|nr:porin [Marinobacter sp. ASW11-75]MEA1080852.1 porin [Marinobacter sp. ASW11-75]
MKVFKITRSMHLGLTSLAAVAMLSGTASNAKAEVQIGEVADTQLAMYGILDGGVLYQDKVTTDGDRKIGVETSGLTPTILGFKGSRTLDNDWNAFFNLEAHFDLDTGMFHGSGDADTDADDGSGRVLFRRQANVGLSGDWGTAIIGRQYGPAVLAHLATEPRGFKEQFSNTYAWAYSQLFTTVNDSSGMAGRNANNDVGFFFKNAVQYRNNLAGVDFGILYSFGGQEGSTAEGDVLSIGAAYAAGPLTLSGSYQRMRDQQTAEDLVTSWATGAAYNLADWTFKLHFMNTENKDASGTEVLDVDALGFGVDWQWNLKNSATVAYYINEDDAPAASAKTRSLVVSNDYSLSESTILYAQMAYVDADDMGVVSQFATSIVANPTPVNEKTALLNVGVNYAF